MWSDFSLNINNNNNVVQYQYVNSLELCVYSYSVFNKKGILFVGGRKHPVIFRQALLLLLLLLLLL